MISYTINIMDIDEQASKEEIASFFAQVFQDQLNAHCYQCFRPSQQWVERSLGIFLCLTCASLYSKASVKVALRSVTLQSWTRQELRVLSLGGNRRYRNFICNYDLQHLTYQDRIETKAAEHYRLRLIELAQGRQEPIAPQPQVGALPSSSLSDLSPEQLLQKAKEKASNLMGKTLEAGSKAYQTVSDKYQNGELKKDVYNAAKGISNVAKSAWQSLYSKFKT